MNHFGGSKKPFLFIISYDLSSYDIIPLDKIPDTIQYTIDKNSTNNCTKKRLDKNPMKYSNYLARFNVIQNEIREGNTYLINFTTQTKIQTTVCIEEIYNLAEARYKMKYKDQFVCFSPEQFCKIEKNKIFTYPMKGTIDANIPNAKEIILNDPKELAEHTMVVDLLRNDLSIISKNVTVENFRFIQKISAGEKELLQVSSEISGELEDNWQNRIGDIICSMLPAGSITGTPKRKTIEIINNTEEYSRGYFTGVFGVFDGESIDSAVMIRFIEKQNDGSLIYKSGGGITCESDPKKEYQEMIDKVYIP